MNEFGEMLSLCQAACKAHKQKGFAVGGIDGDSFIVETKEGTYSVTIEDADVGGESFDTENKWSGERVKETPKKVSDHFGVLDLCLHGLVGTKYQPRMSDLTTDGDHKDCEAIFCLDDDAPVVLKVRPY